VYLPVWPDVDAEEVYHAPPLAPGQVYRPPNMSRLMAFESMDRFPDLFPDRYTILN
jgi:hypothetical protein